MSKLTKTNAFGRVLGGLGLLVALASCSPKADSNSPATQPVERMPIIKVETQPPVLMEFTVKGEGYVQTRRSPDAYLYYFSSETEKSIKIFEIFGGFQGIIGELDALINPGDRVLISFPPGTDLEKTYKFRIDYLDIREINGKRTH